MPAKHYSIKKNRLRAAYMTGIEPVDDYAGLKLTKETARRLYLKAIDSADAGSQWGRLSFDASLTENMTIYVYAAATDLDTVYDENGTYRIDDLLCSDTVRDIQKKELLTGLSAERFVGKSDILLYGLTGQYLYIAIDVIGDGEGYLSNLRVDARGDQFMDTLPEVFRERNGFLHRFLSVFSSIYNDFDRQIDELPDILEIDNAPKEVLLEYGRWMGIDLSGDFLSEEAIRRFVREGYRLNRMKGTRECLMRIFDIVLGEPVIILEQNTIRAYPEALEADPRIRSSSIYDVNILIKKSLSDRDRHQLLHLLRQFVPVRTRLHLIQLKDSGVLDTDIYMDMNAVLGEEAYGIFDDNMELDDDVIME
ncbi:MAG: hypothetical protein IJT32_04655 [Lachnospiraceae bacterium]|nr:hypothetical protein [Lachnospiraceae bacterium]